MDISVSPSASPSRNKRRERSNSKDNGNNGSTNSSSEGVAPAGHQVRSGDITEALVAIAAGGGFDMILSTIQHGRAEVTAEGCGALPSGGPSTTTQESINNASALGLHPTRGERGRRKGADTSLSSLSSPLSRLSAYFESGNQTSGGDSVKPAKVETDAGALLRYLSEDATSTPEGTSDAREKMRASGKEQGSRFPGLEWLVPHIVCRSIPMALR